MWLSKMERAEVGQRRWMSNQDNRRDTLVSAEEEKNINTSRVGRSQSQRVHGQSCCSHCASRKA